MADSNAGLEKETSVGVEDVLAAVGPLADPELGLPDRIEVNQATPAEWTYRLHYRGRREPVGGFLRLEL